ncbi:MAG TPA: hypothetical protein VKE51_01495 [Vicinamibacterales bacterium]|nr:hypothetical protein [Vicinamibacterales bacterium]
MISIPDEDARRLAAAIAEPMKDILERIVTVLEGLNARLEVLELERLHDRTTNAPSEAAREP